MSVRVKKVESRSDLRRFVHFPEKIYGHCENWVPALLGDEYDSFNPKKNGSFEFCDAECYLAYRNGQVVGRVAAIVNRNANRDWKEDAVRFGWLDFIDDREVLEALLAAVKDFGVARGCKVMKGPWGFTDMDKEGLLVEGYENPCPFTCLYNYPYYDRYLSELGFVKDVDWTQKLVFPAESNPPRCSSLRI